MIYQLFKRNEVVDFLPLLIHGELYMLSQCLLGDLMKAERFINLLPYHTQRILNELSLVEVDKNLMFYKNFRFSGLTILRKKVPNSHFYRQCRKWVTLDYPAVNLVNPVGLLQDHTGQRLYDIAYRPGCLLSKLIPKIEPTMRESFAMSFFQQALMAMIQNKQAFGERAEKFRYLNPESIYVEQVGLIRFPIPNLIAPEIACKNKESISNSPYTAPEMRESINLFLYSSDPADEYSSDMWAIGVMCVEIMLGERITDQSYVDSLTEENLILLFRSVGMVTLVKMCLSRVPKQRPSYYRTLGVMYVTRHLPWSFIICDKFTRSAYDIVINTSKPHLTRTALLGDLIKKDIRVFRQELSQELILSHCARIDGAMNVAKVVMSKL